MSNFITAGKRLIPAEHVAFVEPYVAGSKPPIETAHDFQARLVLVNRDRVLIEQISEAFAELHGFRWLALDTVGINPLIAFCVETFSPGDDFQPSRPFTTRLLWRDPDGSDQSKLLLTPPEEVLAVVMRGGSPAAATSRRGRRTAKRFPRSKASS